MRKGTDAAKAGQEPIYTLAQNGTGEKEKKALILNGKGSDMSTKDYAKRKCKTKTISDALVLKMIDKAKKEGREDIAKSFWNTWHCMNRVYTYEGRLYNGKYCKNRFCTTCLGIRKAKMINTYYPILKNWNEPHLLTLTIKSVPKKDLHKMLRKCLEGLNRIIDKYEKRQVRNTGKKLLGIRSLECNFNPVKRTYNPHFHFIVPDLETAETLKVEWFMLWTLKPTKTVWVDMQGQRIDKIWNLDSALIEVIKYGTKVFTDPDKNKKKPKGMVKLYASAYYNIIVGMKGMRLFGSFGFKLPKVKEQKRTPARVVTVYQEWVHAPELQNWVCTEKWEVLFDQLPDASLEVLLQWGIDTELD